MTNESLPTNQHEEVPSTSAPMPPVVEDPTASGRQHTLPPGEAAIHARGLPGYELVEELGRGAMGVVYRARQLTLKRDVALKMILAGAHASEQERLRFLAEAEVIASLDHPGIVRIHDLGTREGLPYFAMEFCPGGSLGRKLSGKPMPPEEAAGLVASLADALQAAHEKGVIHRDLKPSNVLLAADGSPKLADFGLARRPGGGSLTQTGAVVGTPAFMSPEQARGLKPIGPQADVWALGAILYKCLTGRPPFEAQATHEILARVIADEPVLLRKLNPAVPRDLEAVCLKCLEKKPERRYASASELAGDLRRFLRNEPVEAKPATLRRTLHGLRRHAWLGLAFAGIAMALGVGLFLGRATSPRHQIQAMGKPELDETPDRQTISIAPERGDDEKEGADGAAKKDKESKDEGQEDLRDLPTLRQALRDESPPARARAARALGRQGKLVDQETVRALCDRLNDPDLSVRREAASALAASSRSADPEVMKVATGPLFEVVRAEKDDLARVKVLVALTTLADPSYHDHVADVFSLAVGADGEVASLAILILGKMGAVEELAWLLNKSKADKLKCLCCVALSHLPRHKGRPGVLALIEALKPTDNTNRSGEEARELAAEALAQIQYPFNKEAVPELRKRIMEDKNDHVRHRAIWALFNVRDLNEYDLVGPLTRVLDEEGDQKRLLRYDAARLLALGEQEKAPVKVIDALLEMLADPKLKVFKKSDAEIKAGSEKDKGSSEVKADLGGDARYMAAQALGRLGSKARNDDTVVAALRAAANDPEPKLRETANKVLDLLGLQPRAVSPGGRSIKYRDDRDGGE